jgi:hypothetical protein
MPPDIVAPKSVGPDLLIFESDNNLEQPLWIANFIYPVYSPVCRCEKKKKEHQDAAFVANT